MPMAAALVASAFSVSGGMAAITAAGGLMTGGGMLGGLMVAGGALSGIGALTGNKKLLKIGAVLGLAGGVGNLISKGLEEGAKAGVGDAAGKALTDTASSTSGQALEAVTGSAADAANVAGDLAGDFGAINSPAGGLIDAAKGTPGIAGELGTAGPYGAGSGWGGDTLSKMGVANDTAAGFADKAYGAINSVIPGAGTATKGLVDGARDVFGGVSSWAEANPNTAKLASGIVGGGMAYLGQAEAAKQAMAQRKKYEDWVSQRYNASVQNLQIPSPFSTPQRPAGIIAGSRG